MDTHAIHTELVKSGFTDRKAEAIMAAVKIYLQVCLALLCAGFGSRWRYSGLPELFNLN